ncbi:hypothetical protein DPMN_183107 [Dreissena polymorpha]|uniref:Uncharacterized protein n=1 Tax=Dreissena polymorpha TaxID=45954 RepID=A0A9D4I578_DREPO|nr:hypothetical protein DPMN_183107 [Dreissena polymorpha]
MADKHILLSRRAAAFTFSLLLIFFSHVTSMLLGTECPGSFNCTYNGHVSQNCFRSL